MVPSPTGTLRACVASGFNYWIKLALLMFQCMHDIKALDYAITTGTTGVCMHIGLQLGLSFCSYPKHFKLAAGSLDMVASLPTCT